MKKLIALLCVLALMLTVLAACGEKSSDEGQQNEVGSVSSDASSEKDDESAVISIEKIKKAFEDEGYNVTSYDKETVEAGKVDKYYAAGNKINSIEGKEVYERIDITLYECTDTDYANSLYTYNLPSLPSGEEYEKSEINGYSKSYYKCKPIAENGESEINKNQTVMCWKKDSTVIMFTIDWNSYVEAGLGYDNSAEKIIEKLGL